MVKYQASFRIHHENLNPDEISKRLNLNPSKSHRKGDARLGKDGRQFSPFSDGLWSLSHPVPESESLSIHIKFFNSKLGVCKDLLAELRCEGFRMDIYIGIFNVPRTGNVQFYIDEPDIAALVKLGVDLVFDVYS